MKQILIWHAHPWDPAFKYMWQMYVTGDLDGFLNSVPWQVVNNITVAVQRAHAGDNAPLEAGALKLAYPITVAAHTHSEADVIMANGARYLNTGAWIEGHRPHYVLFPKLKIAVISDLHAGELSNVAAVLSFLSWARANGWTVIFNGDTVDLWAHNGPYILKHYGPVIQAIVGYEPKIVIPGNHDSDIKALRKILRIADHVATPAYKIIETDDEPELIGFAA